MLKKSWRNIHNTLKSAATKVPSITSLTCCFCPTGIILQTDLINHLLSHFVVKTEEVPAKENLSPSQANKFKVERLCDVSDEISSPRRFFCNLCEKSFLYKQGLQKHHHKEHNPNVVRIKYQRQVDASWSKIKCDLCPKLFKYKQGANKHWDLEHNPQNTFECPKCSSRCKTLKNLHAHIRTHDPPRTEGVASLQCHKCLKIFDSQKQLSLHFYTHREKFFCCDKCGSKFNNREQIKNHVLRHVGLFQKKVSHQRIIWLV